MESCPVLTIIRGLPGNGKSTLGKAIGQTLGHNFLDIDDYFINDDGVFEFTAAKAQDAFRQLHHDADDLLTAGKSVIVAATFARLFEMGGYLRMSWEHLQVIDCTSSFDSVHDIPMDKMIAQRKRWEPWKKAFDASGK